MDLSTQKVRAFVLIAQTGSFTKAAEALGMTQPSVSRMVSDLEREWGIRLFDRGRNGVVLTDEGRAVLDQAVDLDASVRRLEDAVEEAKDPGRGHLRIGVISSVATHWIPNIIRRFSHDNPGVSYELVLGDYPDLDRWVAEGRVDFAFTTLQPDSQLEQLPVEEDEMFAVVPRGHPLAQLEGIPLESMTGVPFFMLEKDGVREIDGLVSYTEEDLDIKIVTWDDYAIMSMVEAGMGIAILAGLMLRRTPYDVVLRSLNPPVFRTIGVISRKGSRMSVTSQRFLEYLRYRNGDGSG